MKFKAFKRRLTTMLIIAMTGCSGGSITDPFATASGAVADYQWITGKFNLSTNARVMIAVSDQRSYVLSGNKSPAFSGLARAGFGEPFDVLTKSGNSLAKDFSASIVAGLIAAQVQAEALEITPTMGVEAVTEQLLRVDGDRYLRVILQEWKSDTYHRTQLQVSIEITVYDANGSELLRKNFEGLEQARSNKMSPKGRNAEVVASLYPAKLIEILEDAEVVSALLYP